MTTIDLSDPTLFMIVCGAWGIAMVAIFISVIRLSYEVERRSGRRPPGGLPTNANLPAVIFNSGIADDAETQRLRWRVIQRLGVIACGFVVFGLYVNQVEG